MPKTPGQEPGERLNTESQPAWEAFTTYRDMGTDRSVRRVAQEVGKNPTLIAKWSSEHGWVQRCADYDSEIDRQWRATQDKERRAMAIRHAQIAGAVQSKIVARLRTINPEDFTPGDLARLLDISVKVERQARGETEKVELTGKDGGPIEIAAMSTEERRAHLAALVAEAQRRLETQRLPTAEGSIEVDEESV